MTDSEKQNQLTVRVLEGELLPPEQETTKPTNRLSAAFVNAIRTDDHARVWPPL